MLKKTTILALLLSAMTITLRAQETTDVSGPLEFMLARFDAEEGKYAEALARIDRVVAANPDNPVVLHERATMLWESGSVDKARAELQTIVKRFPDFYESHRLLGRLYLEQKTTGHENLELALAELRTALQLTPDDVGSGLTVAQLYLASNRVPEAEKVLAGLAERLPDNKIVNFNYAQVLTKLGQTEKAQPYLERALATDPTYTPAVMQLLDVYQRSSDWKKAADVLEPLSAQDPYNVDLQRQQGYFDLRSGQSEKARAIFDVLTKADPKDDRNQFFLAESLNDLEKYREAEVIYKKLLDASPADPELLVSYGLNLMAQRRYDDASKIFLNLIKIDTIPPGVTVLGKTQLAMIDLYRGDYESALHQARELVSGTRGVNTQAVNLAAEIFRRQKDYQGGVSFFAPLVKANPGDTTLNARYLEFLLRAGKSAEASRLAEQSRNSGKGGALAVAETYAAVQKYPDAIAILKELIKDAPTDKPLQFQLASAYERSGDAAAAEKIFNAILDREPDDPATLNYLGYMWADRGVNLVRAEQLLLRAVAQDPRNGAFIDSLGWIYFKQGKYELAEKQLTDASQLLPFDSTVQSHLGDVLEKMGKRSQALERYRAALKLDPDPTEEAKLRVKIANVEKKTPTEAKP